MCTKKLLVMVLIVITFAHFLGAINSPSASLLKSQTELNCLQQMVPSKNTSRQWQISIPPTPVMNSFYDYMIGGYNSIPMQIVPDEFGGGVFFTFHAKRTAAGTRLVFFPYLNDEGVMQTYTDPVWMDKYSGHPSITFDPVMGKPLFAWHSNWDGSTDLEYEIMGSYDAYIAHFPYFHGDPYYIQSCRRGG